MKFHFLISQLNKSLKNRRSYFECFILRAKYRRLVWLTLLLTTTFNYASASDGNCRFTIRSLVALYQEAATGVKRSINPPLAWRENLLLPEINRGITELEFDALDTEISTFIRDLEDDVIHLLENTPPEFRQHEMERIRQKHQFNSLENVQDVINYYALHIWANPRIAGEPDSVWGRLESLKKEIQLVEPKPNSPQSRYLFYLQSLTRLSVPEMANQLNRLNPGSFTESRVRNELSILQLSIEDEFNRDNPSPYWERVQEDTLRRLAREDLIMELLQQPRNILSRARYLLNHGIFMHDTADVLGVGEPALIFILHYENELNRGVPWGRQFIFRNNVMIEDTLLAHLHEQNLTYAQIAETLNRLSHTEDPSHPMYRTEGAVAARLRLLGLASTLPEREKEREIPPYGKVKENGMLQEIPTRNFLRDRPFQPLTELAIELGVSITTLRNFIEKYHIVRITERPDTAKEAMAILENYDRVRPLIASAHRVQQWIIANGYKKPTRANSKALKENREMTEQELTEQSIYRAFINHARKSEFQNAFTDEDALKVVIEFANQAPNAIERAAIRVQDWLQNNNYRKPTDALGKAKRKNREVNEDEKLELSVYITLYRYARNPEFQNAFSDENALKVVIEYTNQAPRTVEGAAIRVQQWLQNNNYKKPTNTFDKAKRKNIEMNEDEKLEHSIYQALYKYARNPEFQKALTDETALQVIIEIANQAPRTVEGAAIRVQDWLQNNNYRKPTDTLGKAKRKNIEMTEDEKLELSVYQALIHNAINPEFQNSFTDEIALQVVIELANKALRTIEASAIKVQTWIIDNNYKKPTDTFSKAKRENREITDDENLERVIYRTLHRHAKNPKFQQAFTDKKALDVVKQKNR